MALSFFFFCFVFNFKTSFYFYVFQAAQKGAANPRLLINSLTPQQAFMAAFFPSNIGRAPASPLGVYGL